MPESIMSTEMTGELSQVEDRAEMQHGPQNSDLRFVVNGYLFDTFHRSFNQRGV